METNTRRPTMDGLEFASIEEEVIQVLKEMEDDKAPDGFIMAFF